MSLLGMYQKNDMIKYCYMFVIMSNT